MKNKTLKSIVVSVLSVAMLMSFAACGEGGSEKDKKNDSADASASDNADVNSDRKSTIDKNVKVGDYVTFGSYEQDNDTSNGKEPIEWLVLDVQDGRVLVISKYGLDAKRYNEELAEVTWETCTLRKWLNNEFVNTAFTSEEKAKIPTVTVSADANPSYSTDPGNATQDKVYLLSINELNKYFSSDSARVCEPTKYAVVNVADANRDIVNSCWWLRSPRDCQYDAAIVAYGNILDHDYDIGMDCVAVRPAMWVTIG